MKLCVIGNSHTACLKVAWDRLGERYPGIKMTFFAQRGYAIGGLISRKGVLVPWNDRLRAAIVHTSGGYSAIDLCRFDAVLLVGLLWGYPPSLGHYSHAAALRALLDITPTTMAFGLLRKIRKLSDIPVFIAHQPLRSHAGEFEGSVDLAPYRRLVDALNTELMKQHDAVLLPQPPQTIAGSFFTRSEFALQPPRLDIGNRDEGQQFADPLSHMNSRYGDIYLSTHLPTIAFGR